MDKEPTAPGAPSNRSALFGALSLSLAVKEILTMDDQTTVEKIQVVTGLTFLKASKEIRVESVQIKLPHGTEVDPPVYTTISLRNL